MHRKKSQVITAQISGVDNPRTITLMAGDTLHIPITCDMRNDCGNIHTTKDIEVRVISID